MTNEERTEELLHKAYLVKKGKEVIDRASCLIKAGVERYQAFTTAYFEIVKKDEIYGERHKGQGETSEDGEKRS
jgi:hypothetical protein